MAGSLHEAACSHTASEGMQVDHVNGVKTDDRACNLQWVNQSVNIYRSYHVQNLRTKEADRSKGYMTEAEYDEVFRLHREEKLSQVAIGRLMGRSNSTISKILAGKTRPKPAVVVRPVKISRFEVRRARLEMVRNMRVVNPGITSRQLAELLGVSVARVNMYRQEIERERVVLVVE